MRAQWSLMGVSVMMSCGAHLDGAPVTVAVDAARQDEPASSDAALIDAALPSHVPSGPATPFDPEAIPGGSVEGQPGFGWDACATRTAGNLELAPAHSGEGLAANGDLFLRFTPGVCTGAPAGCALDRPSDAQVYFVLPEARTLDVGASLEFDMISFGGAVTRGGSLTIYAVDARCVTTRVLAKVLLDELQLVRAWRPRCIALPATAIAAIGIAVTGEGYDVALDALRFGSRCQ